MMKKAKIIQQLHKSQLFKQYFKRILLFFSVPCLLFSIILYSSYQSHNNTIAKRSFSSTSEYSVRALNNIFNEVHKKYYLINSDKTIRNTMFLSSENFFLPENQASVSSLNSTLTYSLDTSNVIDSIYLYSTNNNYVYCADKTLLVSSNYFDKFTDKSWLSAYEKDTKTQLIIGQYNDQLKSNVVSVIYQMYSGNVNTGFLVFNITEKTLKNALIPDNDSQNTNIFIKNGDKEIFSTRSEGLDAFTKNSSYTLIHSEKLDFPNITLTVTSSPNNKSLFSPLLLGLFLLLLSVIIPVFMSLALSNSFYTSVSKISSYLLNLFPQENDIKNEMDFIQDNLKKIVQTSQNLEKTVAHYLHETQQAQLISLQTQLNPHFLFNTLNALSLMNSTDSSKDDFELLVRDLSNILSYCLNTTNNLVTVYDEIEYSKYYIEMESIKYRAKINVKFNIPDELCTAFVPKFIFQPILENSFKHGFKYMFTEQNNIDVSAGIEEDTLVIKFYNNGCGIQTEVAEKTNIQLSNGYFPQNKHIGLYNVNKRIQLFYGKNFGCRIYPCKEGGTLVVIKIPANH